MTVETRSKTARRSRGGSPSRRESTSAAAPAPVPGTNKLVVRQHRSAPTEHCAQHSAEARGRSPSPPLADSSNRRGRSNGSLRSPSPAPRDSQSQLGPCERAGRTFAAFKIQNCWRNRRNVRKDEEDENDEEWSRLRWWLVMQDLLGDCFAALFTLLQIVGILLVVTRAIGWITSENFGITCPVHGNLTRWSMNDRATIAVRLDELEVYVKHVRSIETDMMYLRDHKARVRWQPRQGTRADEHWEDQLQSFRQEEVERAKDTIAFAQQELGALGVFPCGKEACLDLASCAGSGARPPDSHELLLPQDQTQLHNNEETAAAKAMKCYRDALARIHRLQLRTSCAGGFERIGIWHNQFLSHRHGWCGMCPPEFLNEWASAQLVRLQAWGFDVEPRECTTLWSWVVRRVWWLWDTSGTLLGFLGYLVLVKDSRDHFAQLRGSLHEKPRIFAGLIKVSLNVLYDRGTNRVFGMRTVKVDEMENFFFLKDKSNPRSLASRLLGIEKDETSGRDLYEKLCQNLDGFRPHEHESLRGRYPVVQLREDHAKEVILIVKNQLSSIFGTGHVAKALGAQCSDAKLIFALTWEYPDPDANVNDQYRIMVAQESVLREIKANPNPNASSITMEDSTTYYKERYQHLAVVYSQYESGQSEHVAHTALHKSFEKLKPVVGDLRVSVVA